MYVFLPPLGGTRRPALGFGIGCLGISLDVQCHRFTSRIWRFSLVRLNLPSWTGTPGSPGVWPCSPFGLLGRIRSWPVSSPTFLGLAPRTFNPGIFLENPPVEHSEFECSLPRSGCPWSSDQW